MAMMAAFATKFGKFAEKSCQLRVSSCQTKDQNARQVCQEAKTAGYCMGSGECCNNHARFLHNLRSVQNMQQKLSVASFQLKDWRAGENLTPTPTAASPHVERGEKRVFDSYRIEQMVCAVKLGFANGDAEGNRADAGAEIGR
jgi:hypothetical protein